MDSRLVRIFCANLPSQKARGESYNLLLFLRKDCLFCHRSECYGPPSPSISLESIKSQREMALWKQAGLKPTGEWYIATVRPRVIIYRTGRLGPPPGWGPWLLRRQSGGWSGPGRDGYAGSGPRSAPGPGHRCVAPPDPPLEPGQYQLRGVDLGNQGCRIGQGQQVTVLDDKIPGLSDAR